MSAGWSRTWKSIRSDAARQMERARRILIGITGGIAAYKIPLLVRLLRKNGCEVKTVLTPAARQLVGVEALRTLSGNPVYIDGESLYDMGHIRLSEWADVLLIAPATANTIAKIAHGVADNLLTTLALSIPEERVIIAPAMNCVMWRNGATRANVAALEARGASVMPVEEGELACGVSGPGRMPDVDEIARRVLAFWSDSSLPDSNPSPNNGSSLSLAGKRVLISSGPTEEPIDPVRAITNRSSGKMGAALASAALSMGARVTVVSGPARAELPAGAEVVAVKTASEMQAEMEKRFGAADVCVMAAAVSDFRPVNFSTDKLQRSERRNITLELTPNPDILAGLGAVKSGQFLVGFSLESGGGAERAKEKMKRKNCDMMVCNSVDAALGGDGTEFTLLFADGRREGFSAMGKTEAARVIFENVARVVNTI